MKSIVFYEPAMCCPTGLCGVNVNPELLRISTVINNLTNNGVHVERLNLSSNPNAFIRNIEIQQLIKRVGIKVLPVTVIDGKIVKTSAYPSNEELIQLLNITEADLSNETKKAKTIVNNDCNCSEGGCE